MLPPSPPQIKSSITVKTSHLACDAVLATYELIAVIWFLML
jgi:hypothetical protein